jgi:hypothetical protein
LLRPEFRECFAEKIRPLVFEDPNSPLEQSGLFKCEGIYTESYFRSLKCYYLANPEEKVVRLRSIPRWVSGLNLARYGRLAYFFRRAQECVPKDKFGPLQGDRDVVVKTTALRPTLGFEMTIQRESKTLSHTLNFKRRGVVSRWRPKDELPSLQYAVSISGFCPHRGAGMREEDERELEKYFFLRAKEGRIPSFEAMQAHAKKRGIGVTRKFLRGLRYKFKFTAIFSHKRKPKHFMGMAIQRYGVLMLDRAYFDYKRDEEERASLPPAPRSGKGARRRAALKTYKGN